MRKFNHYTNLALLFNGIFLIGNGTGLLPEFIKGICIGLGLTLIFMGIYSEKQDISKLRNYKKKLIGK